MKTLEQALPHADAITAFGLDSSEVGHPPAKIRLGIRAGTQRSFLTVCARGEEGRPLHFRGLDLLRVRRIDHGVRCEEDPALIARSVRERVPLTMCHCPTWCFGSSIASRITISSAFAGPRPLRDREF